MKCPVCGVWTIVKTTRKSEEFGYIRRRECANEHKFSTTEVLIPQEKIDAFKRKVLLEQSKNGWEASARVRSKGGRTGGG